MPSAVMKYGKYIMGVLAITMLLVAPFALPQQAYGQTPPITASSSITSTGITSTSGTSTTPQDKVPSNTKEKVNWLDCISPTRPLNAASCGISILVMVGTSVVSIFISLAAWLVQFMLIISFRVADSQVVVRGYDILLAVANMGFVLGIIIIAIATILRLQGYGAKQLLWKLIVMAIAVNFGLVVAKTMINVSNNVAYFLIDKTAPTGNATGVGITDIKAYGQKIGGYVDALTQGIGPQALFPKDSTSLLQSGGVQNSGNWFIRSLQELASGNVTNAAKEIVAQGAADTDAFVVSLANGLFVIIFLILSLVVFLALGLMLLLRFIWLTMLLILLPIAWLSWIFPLAKEWWKTWWQKFIRWTFFPPVMLFFTYLALLVQKSTPANANNVSFVDLMNEGVKSTIGTGTTGGVLALFSGSAAIILSNLAQKTVIIGLLIGGFMAANKMSITGAKTALAVGEGIAKNTGTWAKNRAKGAGLRYLTTKKNPPPQGATGFRRLMNTLNPQGLLAPKDALSTSESRDLRGQIGSLSAERTSIGGKLQALNKERDEIRGRLGSTLITDALKTQYQDELQRKETAIREEEERLKTNQSTLQRLEERGERAGIWTKEDRNAPETEEKIKEAIRTGLERLADWESRMAIALQRRDATTEGSIERTNAERELQKIEEEGRGLQREQREAEGALKSFAKALKSRERELNRVPLFESITGRGIVDAVWGPIAKGLEKGMSEEQKKKIFDEGKKLLNSDGIIRSSVDVGLKKLFDSKTKDEKLKHALHEIEELTGVKVKHDDHDKKGGDDHGKPAAGGGAQPAPAGGAAPHH